MNSIIGKGSYGEVSIRGGVAVKKFAKLSHLIQEYAALIFLKDCDHIVKCAGVDFVNLELHMDLYDTSLRKWLEEHKHAVKPKQRDAILKDILIGLIQLHDRGLVHGDLKPGNILVKNNPLRCVLGDCGFVSIAKYAKVDRTAAIYKEPVISHDSRHDMFSFGICMLELVGDVRIGKQSKYEGLRMVIKKFITDQKFKNIIKNLLSPNKDIRFTSRQVYKMLYDEPLLNLPHSEDFRDGFQMTKVIENEDNVRIRKTIKSMCTDYKIYRARYGYKGLIWHLSQKDFKKNSDKETFYIATVCMILSAIFGKSGYREEHVYKITNYKYGKRDLCSAIHSMTSDQGFLKNIFA